MAWYDNKDYSKSINPKQLEELLKKKASEGEGASSQPFGTSIFDSMASERAESLEYFEVSNVQNSEKTIVAMDDSTANEQSVDSKKPKDKNLAELLTGVLSIDGVKKNVDTNNDGVVDNTEMKKFLSGVKGLDGDDKNISLNDFELALNKMGIDINKILELKKSEAEQNKKLLQELQNPDFYKTPEPPKVNNGGRVAQNGMGNYSNKNVQDAQSLANAITNGGTLEELKTQKTTIEADIKVKEANIAAINDGSSPKIASAKQAVDTSKKNMDESVKNDAKLSDSLKQSFNLITTKITENDGKLSQNNTQITQKESSISQGNNSVSSLESSLGSLAKPSGKPEDKDKDASLSSRKSDLEGQIKDKKSQVETLKSDLEKLKQEKGTLEKTKTDLAQQKSIIEAEVLKNCDPKTKTAIETYNKAKTDLEQLKQTELATAKTELDSKIKELNDVNVKISEKENKKAEGVNFDFGENMTDAQKDELAQFKKHYDANKARYESVAKSTGVPAELIASLHWREGGGNFGTYMHNGDPLGKPTTHVPAGISCSTWEESAVDALSSKNNQGLTADSKNMDSYYEFAERYNGLGYRNKGVSSPYVWSGTDKYSQGKYVADGQYDPSAKDRQLGVAIMLKQIMT